MMQEKRSICPELEEVEKNINLLQAGYMVERQRCSMQPNGKGESCSVQLWETKLQAYCNARQGTSGLSEKARWDDTKAFLASFEEVAEACQWPKREWVTRLRPALSGDAKHAYSNLDVKCREDYEEVKAAILRMDALRMETQRQHFRRFFCQEIKDPHWLHCQIQELCHQWLKPERRSKEQILELLILEQFLASLPPNLQDWIQAKGPNSCSQAVTLVEDFLKPLNEKPVDSHNAEQEIQEEAKQNDDKGTKHERDTSSPLLLERTGMDEPGLVERQTNLKEASDGTSPVVEEMPIQPGPQTVFWEVIQESNRNIITLGGTTGNEAKANIQPEQNQLEETFGKVPQISDGIMIVECEIEEACMVGEQPVLERHEFSRLTEGLSAAVQPSAVVDTKDKMPVLSRYSRRYRFMPEFDTVLIQETHQESPESEEMFQPNLHLGECQRAIKGRTRRTRPKNGSHDSSRPQVNEEPNITQTSGKGLGDQKALRNSPRAQHRDRPYWCSQCGESFLQKEYLRKHKRIHSGPKPFDCLHCGKCYKNKGALKRHQLTHTREKTFQCSECGKRFGRKDTLALHRKSHKRQKPLNPEELHLQR